MAPESIRTPGRVDARADIYAIGAVGYFLLTGAPVFGGSSLVRILSDHLHAEPVAPSARLGKPVSSDLESLLLECLAKAPDARPASAFVLRDRLRACKDAGTWTEENASIFWRARALATKKVAPTAIDAWSATTLAVDVEHRSPAAISLATPLEARPSTSAAAEVTSKGAA
jgi:serine/threonine-protein kinase